MHVNSKSDVAWWRRRNPLWPERWFQPRPAEHCRIGNGPRHIPETGRGCVRDERKREDHFPLRKQGAAVGILTTNRKGYEMSEAKPQDGSTVKGYRTLTPADIEMMNEVKAISREFLKKLDFLKFVHESESEPDPQTLSSLAIARTKMQEACMWACRAVARPDADC